MARTTCTICGSAFEETQRATATAALPACRSDPAHPEHWSGVRDMAARLIALERTTCDRLRLTWASADPSARMRREETH
jgi:hypothetical protein